MGDNCAAAMRKIVRQLISYDDLTYDTNFTEEVVGGDRSLLRYMGRSGSEGHARTRRDSAQGQGCNSIDIWNLRLELGFKLRHGLRMR